MTLFLPLPPATAQQTHKMGVTTSEKNSDRVGLPNILNKQDNKGPAMSHQIVAKKDKPEKEAEESKNKELEESKASTLSEEKPEAEKKAESKPGTLNKRLGGMGIDADSMTQAVFLRHEVVSKSDK